MNVRLREGLDVTGWVGGAERSLLPEQNLSCWPIVAVLLRDRLVVTIELFTFALREAVAENDTVDVIGFVLETTPERAACVEFDLVTVLVLSSTDRELWPCEVGVCAGEGQASFTEIDEVSIVSFGEFDYRIADDTSSPCPGLVTAIVDEHRKVDAYLLSGEAGTVRSSIGREHIGKQTLQIRTEVGHRSSRCVQDRVAPSDDWSSIAEAQKFRDRHDSYAPPWLR